MYLKLCFVLSTFHMSEGLCTFKSEPVDVFVHFGATVYFGCECYEEDQALPSWKINGATYPISRLPWPHTFDNELSSLVVPEVSVSMNTTTYQCYRGDDSSIGTLYVYYIREDSQSFTIWNTTSIINTKISIRETLKKVTISESINQTSYSSTCLQVNETMPMPTSNLIAIGTSIGVCISAIILILLGFMILCRQKWLKRIKLQKSIPNHIYEDPNHIEPTYEEARPKSESPVEFKIGFNEAYSNIHCGKMIVNKAYDNISK